MYVIGKDEALQFVNKNCTLHKERFLGEIKRGENQSWLYRLLPEIKKAFVVEGVTELVDVFTFNRVTESRDAQGHNIYYLEFGVMEPCIRHIATGTIGYPYQSQSSKHMFGLVLKHEDMPIGSTTYFSYKDEEKPNFVGTGSKKKMDDWFGFLVRENEAKKKYIGDARAKNLSFQKTVREKYPDAWLHIVDDGWMSECKFTVGYVEFHFTAGEDGRFYRSTKVDILKVPSNKDLFGEEVM